MISDVHSFTHAMFYMKAFNDVNNLVFFWDEPTISLDVAEHPLHAEIQAVWRHNLIPNVILSSATLPKLESLPGLVKSFSDKFEDNRINYICTFDLKKSIPLLTSDGYILMPHYMYDDYDKILQLVNHCMCNLTMLRYLDLTDILRFLGLVEEKGFVVESLFLKRKFVALEDISVENIKLHYLEVLGNIKSGCWGSLYLECASQRKRMYPLPADHEKDVWGVYLSTWDAFTLTDGPTIFLTKDADKIAKFLIQKSCIPVEILKGIYADIEKNSQLSVRLQKIATKLGSGEEERSSKGSEKGSNKSKKEEAAEEKVLTGQQRKLQEEEMALLAQLKMVELSEMYVPNKPLHLRHWNRDRLCNSFCSDISSSIVTRVMAIADVSDDFKLLLLMGIGVFSSTIVNNDYLEVMKELANDQKLYLIVASGDYVFGTNYQFCHAYLSKDLDLTQEKMVQCIGRVGRKQTQQNYTIRLRDDKCGETLFMPQVNAMEIENMNRLFS